LQKEVGIKKKAKQDATELLAEIAAIKEEKRKKDDEAAAKLVKLTAKVKSVGNYVHPDVPVSDNEDNNKILRTFVPEGEGAAKAEFNKDGIPHHGVLTRLGGYDPERGVKIVGHRGYFLTNYGYFLNMALIVRVVHDLASEQKPY